MNRINRIIKETVSSCSFVGRSLNNEKLLDKNSCRILMYHSIEDCDLTRDYMGLSVSPLVFYKHMEYLKENNFRVMSLLDLVQMIREKSVIPQRSVVITFDDGYKSILNRALPILKEFNFTAVLFINIYFLQKNISQNLYWSALQTLTWKEVRHLHNSGISIGSHAFTHNKLAEMNKKDLKREIMESRDLIEQNINCEVNTFSYPQGSFNKEAIEMLKAGNFLCACSSIEGLNDIKADIFTLRRTEITAFDNSLFRFKKKLLGCYDWLALTRK